MQKVTPQQGLIGAFILLVLGSVYFYYTHRSPDSESSSQETVTSDLVDTPALTNSVEERGYTAGERMLTGTWKAEKDNGFRDYIDFSIDAETREQIFMSHYDMRPADQGTWELEGDALILYSNINWKYTALTVTKDILQMTNSDGEIERYRRN